MRQGSSGRGNKGAEGSMAVVYAVVMIVLVGMASLAVDLGHLYAERNDLQNTVDAASQVAARSLMQQDSYGVAFLDASGAVTQAVTTINNAMTSRGLPSIGETDAALSINFGKWDDRHSTWTLIGDKTLATTGSGANAVEVKLTRGTAGSYGKVTNFFGGIFSLVDSSSTAASTTVAVTSRSYMGYIAGIPLGTAPIPLALPVVIMQAGTASTGEHGWFAWLFGAKEAVADTGTWNQYTFKDTMGNNVDTGVTGSPSPTVSATQTNQGFWFTANPNDQVPNTLNNIITEAAITSHTHSNSSTSLTASGRTVYFVDALTYGQQVYARSEYLWGSYNATNFSLLSTAFNAKKGTRGKWRMTLPVFTTTQYPLTQHRPMDKVIRYLARLLGPADAFACYQVVTPPQMYVNAFVNVDLTAVGYNSSCNDCSSFGSFPRTITTPAPISGTTYYTNKKDCMTRLSTSCWNLNNAVFKNVVDYSTVIPNLPLNTANTAVSGTNLTNNTVKGSPGGPSYHDINTSAATGVGAYGNVPKLIPRN